MATSSAGPVSGPVSGSALRRRSLLLGAFGGATAAALAALGHTGTAAAGERDEPVHMAYAFVQRHVRGEVKARS